MHGFDAENNVLSIDDRMAVIRVAEGAVKAIIELRSSSLEETSINLPFFTVGTTGPLHLEQRVTRAKLAELDAMGVYVVREAAPPPPPIAQPAADPKSPEKKAKRWWQF
jgi:Hsp70 protein